MAHRKYENPKKGVLGFVPRPRRNAFSDIGDNTSVGSVDGVDRVHGKKKPIYEDMAVGGDKKNLRAMNDALRGQKPKMGSNGVEWEKLSGRQVMAGGRRTFDLPEDGGFKRITQTRYRSGSITEEHEHLDDQQRRVSAGAIMHMDRDKKMLYVDKHRRSKISDSYS